MYKHIKIKDEINKDFLSVTLFELLKNIQHYGDKFTWSIYELDATGNLGEGCSLPELEDKIDSLESGFIMCWNDLLVMSSKLSQVINLILIASNVNQAFEKYEDSNDWRKKYPIIVEIVDGDYWEVYSSNENLIDSLEKKYKDTEVSVAE